MLEKLKRLYNLVDNSNTNIRGKIPVQVKGVTVKKFSEGTRKY